MTTTEVTKFDPASYVDKLREKIKQGLLDVIPDEQWNTMLKHEVDAFFRSKVVNSGYGSPREEPSEFRRIVMSVLEDDIKNRVRAMLTGPEWTDYWDTNNKQKVGEEISKLARENGAAILSKWLEAMFSQMIDRIRFER